MKKRIYKDTILDDIISIFGDYYSILGRIGIDKHIKKKIGHMKQNKPHQRIRWWIKKEMQK